MRKSPFDCDASTNIAPCLLRQQAPSLSFLYWRKDRGEWAVSIAAARPPQPEPPVGRSPCEVPAAPWARRTFHCWRLSRNDRGIVSDNSRLPRCKKSPTFSVHE